MKKNIKSVIVFSALLICLSMLLVAFAGCANSNPSNNTDPDSKENQTLAFAAASSLSVLRQSVPSQNVNTENKSTVSLDTGILTDTQSGESSAYLEAINTINDYIFMFEGYVGEDTPVENDIENSDREGYQYKMTITVTQTENQSEQIVLYYNETLNTEETDDDETEYTLTGIIVLEGKEYAVEGRRTLDKDENELEFSVKISDNTKVVFEQEWENGEQEFNYSVFINGKLFNSFSVEMEKFENKTELEITTVIGNVEFSLELSKKTENDKDYYYAEYKCGSISFEIKLSVVYENGNLKIQYESENGGIIEKINSLTQSIDAI